MDLDYKKLAQAKKDDILRDLDELIAIDSSEDLNNTSKEYPVGPGPVKAMKKFLSFAERDGFHIKNVDNYAGTSTMVMVKNVLASLVTWM